MNNIISINDNTFKLTAKDDPKDRLEVEIGDAKQEEFYPQIKIKRWDNECNFSVRLTENEIGEQTFKLENGKVIWNKGNLSADFYEESDSFKFIWRLKEKPATNKVQFSIQSKDAEFYYQPPLTQKEIDEGAVRPENVVGSYAVYAKTPKTNWKGGKLYRTGKIGHIYRPRLKDSKGWEAWGNLHIENGLYEITIPEDFYNNAVYPIRSNDDFGYKIEGDSYFASIAQSTSDISATIGMTYPLTEDGNITQMSAALLGSSVSQSLDLFFAVYREDSAGSDSHDLVASAESLNVVITFNVVKFYDISFASELLTADDYILAALGNGEDLSAGSVRLYYDSGASHRYYFESTEGSGSYATRKAEDPWTEIDSSGSYLLSIYATYTPAGGEEYTMSVTVGAFTLTGINVLLTKALNMAVSVGTFTLTGIDTVFTKALNMAVAVGVFTLTGVDVAFTKALNMAVAVGQFTLTGINVGLKRGYVMACSVGAFTLTGIATTFTKALNMAVSVGSFILTGINVFLRSSAITNAVKHSADTTNIVKHSASTINIAKHSASATNIVKHSASATNAVKHSASITNQAKS